MNINESLKKHIDIINNYDQSTNIDIILDEMINELKSAQFIIPLDGDDYLTLGYGDDPLDFIIPVFTDFNEYQLAIDLFNKNGINIKDYKIATISPFVEASIESIAFIGLSINMCSQNYIVSNETLRLITDKKEELYSYTPEQLKQIFNITDNIDLVKNIKTQNINDEIPESVIDALSKSVLFSLVGSEITIDDHIENGVINIENHPEHFEDLNLLLINTKKGNYLVLLTDHVEAKSTSSDILSSNPKNFIYSKIANFSHICDLILENDLDGIVINPNNESYYLSKNALSKHYNSLKTISLDPSLAKSETSLFTIN